LLNAVKVFSGETNVFNKPKPFSLPSSGYWYRLLAIRVNGERSVRDFRQEEEDLAKRMTQDPTYTSAVLYNRENEVIVGRMAAKDVQQFSDIFSAQLPRSSFRGEEI
jgi:hypothetical protein